MQIFVPAQPPTDTASATIPPPRVISIEKPLVTSLITSLHAPLNMPEDLTNVPAGSHMISWTRWRLRSNTLNPALLFLLIFTVMTTITFLTWMHHWLLIRYVWLEQEIWARLCYKDERDVRHGGHNGGCAWKTMWLPGDSLRQTLTDGRGHGRKTRSHSSWFTFFNQEYQLRQCEIGENTVRCWKQQWEDSYPGGHVGDDAT